MSGIKNFEGTAKWVAERFSEIPESIEKIIVIYYDDKEEEFHRIVTSATLRTHEVVGLLESAKTDIILDSLDG